MSLLLVRLPETKLTPVLISSAQIQESTGPAYWQMETGLGPDDVDAWILLANPSAPELENWLAEWNVAYPQAPSIGGLASGGRDASEHVLLLDGRATDAAVLALAVKGREIRTIVSQGCKPVGEPFTITRAEENLVYEMGLRPAYQVLERNLQRPLDGRTRACARQSLRRSRRLRVCRRSEARRFSRPQLVRRRSANRRGRDRRARPHRTDAAVSTARQNHRACRSHRARAAQRRRSGQAVRFARFFLQRSRAAFLRRARITMPPPSRKSSARTPARVSSATARSARSGTPVSSTVTPLRSRSSANSNARL